MYKLFDHIQVRDDFTIPSEPGFCFTNGFMRNGVEEYKDISFTYRYEGKEDFYISLQSSNFSEDLSLLESPEEYDPDGEGYTVYKGTRESNHLVMEEWIRIGDFFTMMIIVGEMMKGTFLNLASICLMQVIKSPNCGSK